MEAGWSPTAAVTARLAGGALVMAVFATIVKPDWFREALQHGKTVVAYGLIPIAGAQLCYYNAVSHLSVGVALLLEYTAPILVVGWLWATTRRRPSNLTLTGVALAIAGIMLVLNVFSGAHINVIGVGWALAAAVCAACYFLMSDSVGANGDGLNPITLAAGGLIVGAAVHHHRHRYRGVDDVVGGPGDRAEPHLDRHRLHAGHHGYRAPQATVRLAGGPVRGDVRRAGGLGAGR
jgi:drug/metabolite transporter (DMT)-like permease